MPHTSLEQISRCLGAYGSGLKRLIHLLGFVVVLAVGGRAGAARLPFSLRHTAGRRVVVSPATLIVSIVAAGSLLFLAALGMVGGMAGRVGVLRTTVRVVFLGALAMALTIGIGALVGKAV